MKTRLSNSAINKYLECPKKYYYHYKEKLRSPYKSAALIFGDSMDNSLNSLLKNQGNPEDVFNQYWTSNKVSGDHYEDIPENTMIRYAESDFDKDLIQEEDVIFIKARMAELNINIEPFEYLKIVQDKKKEVGYDKLEENEIRIYNLINWFSLKRKAPIMLKAYRKKILPRIKKVHDVQKYIKMTNDEGDEVIGYIDLVVDFEDDNGVVRKIIADNKTSSMDYAKDSVMKSQQLSIYAISEDISHAAFFVIKKQISKNRTKTCEKCNYNGIKENNRLTTAKSCDNVVESKRCSGSWIETIDPEARVDIIFDEIKEITKEAVVETIDDVNKAIKAEIFPRNFNACENWGGCEYKNKCFYGSNKGLVKK